MKVTRSYTLDHTVVELLEKEKNKSRIVSIALIEYYKKRGENGSKEEEG